MTWRNNSNHLRNQNASLQVQPTRFLQVYRKVFLKHVGKICSKYPPFEEQDCESCHPLLWRIFEQFGQCKIIKFFYTHTHNEKITPWKPVTTKLMKSRKCKIVVFRMWNSQVKSFSIWQKVWRQHWGKLNIVRKLWESVEKVVRKFWESCEKVVRKLWESCEKVTSKLWESFE